MKTNETKHTPTPWKVGVWKDEKGDTTVIKSGATVIADLQWQLDDREDANAAFIVRAVNSHEELLDAVKNLIDEGSHTYSRDEILDLIAKAEGK